MWSSWGFNLCRVLFLVGGLGLQSTQSLWLSRKPYPPARSCVVVSGNSRIQRVGPAADDIEVAPPPPEEGEEEDETVIPNMNLDAILSPPPNSDVTQMGPTTLAYVGDAVFELFVRSKMVWPTRRTADLQLQVTSLVRAEHQAKLLKKLLETWSLTPTEERMIIRGRNSGAAKGNRRKTKDYNDATALEALIGYVYITDKERCQGLMNWMYAYLETVGESSHPDDSAGRKN